MFPALFPRTVDAAAQKRVALVIGNANYSVSPLSNPVNDATDIARRLQGYGFEVFKIFNASQKEMEQSIRRFHRSLFTQGTVGLFYYAGHAVELGGSNYLIPVDAEIHSEADVKYETVNVGRLLDGMSDANNGLNIVVLDACRNNPFSRSFRSAGRGLVPSNPATGTIILYATEPANVAEDGDGRNGTFTLHLLNAMNKPGLTVEEVFKRTAISVNRATKGNQTPWSEGFVLGDFYFMPSDTSAAGASLANLPDAMPSVVSPPPPPSTSVVPVSSGAAVAPPPPPPPVRIGASRYDTLASVTALPSAPVAPVAKGYLQVKVNTQAKVFVDGLEKGTAHPSYPLNIASGLPSRKVHVYAKADGFDTHGEYVNIKPGEWQVVFLQLPKASSWSGAAAPLGSRPSGQQPSSGSPVANLLKACRAYLQANRLSVGKNNAVTCYSEVLDMDPGNDEARQGMASIGKKYRRLAKNAMRTKNFDQARTYIQRLARIDPDDHSLPELRADLREREQQWQESQKAKQVAQAPPPAVKKTLVREVVPARPVAPPARPGPPAPMTAADSSTASGVAPASLYALELAQLRRQAARRECLFKSENSRLQCERDNTQDHVKCMEEQRERARYAFETALSAYTQKNSRYAQCAQRFREEDRRRRAAEEEERGNRMMDHQTLISTLPARRYHSVQDMCGNPPTEPKSDEFLDFSQCKEEKDCERDFERQRSMCDLL